MSFASTPLFVHVKPSVYSMILISASCDSEFSNFVFIHLFHTVLLKLKVFLMFNIDQDFKRQKLKP